MSARAFLVSLGWRWLLLGPEAHMPSLTLKPVQFFDCTPAPAACSGAETLAIL